jgi:hypothetical protein
LPRQIQCRSSYYHPLLDHQEIVFTEYLTETCKNSHRTLLVLFLSSSSPPSSPLHIQFLFCPTSSIAALRFLSCPFPPGSLSTSYLFQLIQFQYNPQKSLSNSFCFKTMKVPDSSSLSDRSSACPSLITLVSSSPLLLFTSISANLSSFYSPPPPPFFYDIY